jgi:hypothetical protein
VALRATVDLDTAAFTAAWRAYLTAALAPTPAEAPAAGVPAAGAPAPAGTGPPPAG